MQMFMQLGLFRLLSENPQNEVSRALLEELYDEFALKVFKRLQLEQNYAELYFVLGFVHSKLAGVCERLSGRQGKKCPEISIQCYGLDKNGHAVTGMAYHSTYKPN